MNIFVRGNQLEFAGKNYRCAVGKNGFSPSKKEGDLCTPIGEFALRQVYYRADKIAQPITALPIHATLQSDGWCDDADSELYNQHITLPFSARHEKLWRDDDVYDIVVVLGYNDAPVVAGAGSAIFMHIAKPNFDGTKGCIALSLPDLLEVLALANSTTRLQTFSHI